jgi:serine/threonine protein kinase
MVSDTKNYELPLSSLASFFSVKHALGVGSFGVVFLGSNNLTGQEVAIKVGHAKRSQVLYEAKVYKSLSRSEQSATKSQGIVGSFEQESSSIARNEQKREDIVGSVEQESLVPQVHWSAVVGDWNVMVMELLGSNLEQYFVGRGRQLSWHEISMFGVQLIERIEHVHSRGFIHRDIKPENVVLSAKDDHKVRLIDYGSAKKYRDAITHEHIACETNKTFLGNMNFASLNAHLGLQQSRRDDLEAIVLILIYLAQGSLPWMGQGLACVAELKKVLTPNQLCDGLPSAFAKFLKHCRNLSFEERPNYAYLTKLMHRLSRKQGSCSGSGPLTPREV